MQKILTNTSLLDVSIMSNGFIGKMENYKALEDKICEALVELG